MKLTERGSGIIVGMIGGAVLTVALCLGAWVLTANKASARVTMTSSYQAVLLSNGSAYFGKLEGLGTPFPVLTEVYYVQSTQDAQTKQVNNILVRRGKEWHSPDRMILNASMIVLVEPVSPNSRVAQLISQQAHN